MNEVVKKDFIRAETMSIIDDNDETAVFNLMPVEVQDIMKAVPGEIWEMSVAELEKNGDIQVTEKKLRIAFWIEYERAKRNGTGINLNHVAKGIVSPATFKKKTLSNHFCMAYILTPPENYKVKMEEMLMLALEEERKILSYPLVRRKIFVKKDGTEVVNESLDTNLAMVKHKIRESIQNRVHGATIQKTHQVTVNKNFNTNVDVTPEDMKTDDLEKYVEELKARSESSVIDVGGATDGVGESGIKDEHE